MFNMIINSLNNTWHTQGTRYTAHTLSLCQMICLWTNFYYTRQLKHLKLLM